MPHKDEYYLSITTNRNGWEVSFSEAGGIHIEEVGKGAGNDDNGGRVAA